LHENQKLESENKTRKEAIFKKREELRQKTEKLAIDTKENDELFEEISLK